MIANSTPHYCESLPVPKEERFVSNVLMEDFKKERLERIWNGTNNYEAKSGPKEKEIEKSEYNAMIEMRNTKMCVNNPNCDFTLLDFYLWRYDTNFVVAEIGGHVYDHCGIPKPRLGVCSRSSLVPVPPEGGEYPRKKMSVYTVKRLKDGNGRWLDKYDKVQTYKFAVRTHIVEKFLAVRNAVDAGTSNIARNELTWYEALDGGNLAPLGNNNNRLEVSHIDHDKMSITFLRIETKNNNLQRKQDCFSRVACSASGCKWTVKANICKCTPKCIKTLWILCEEHCDAFASTLVDWTIREREQVPSAQHL
eukprot:scaffold21524_cov139-Skeletonema_dohrnii-CCMP3373.AAC.3